MLSRGRYKNNFVIKEEKYPSFTAVFCTFLHDCDLLKCFTTRDLEKESLQSSAHFLALCMENKTFAIAYDIELFNHN